MTRNETPCLTERSKHTHIKTQENLPLTTGFMQGIQISRHPLSYNSTADICHKYKIVP